jgi:hypothetical protein
MKQMKYSTSIIHVFISILLSLHTHMLNSQTKIGINTSLPLAALHVKDSSVVFATSSNLPPFPALPPLQGSGSRNMWYVDKAAWFSGNSSNNSWDKDSIGNFSFGLGNNPKAIGLNSISWGENSQARNENSFALSKSSKAKNNGAIVIGNNANGIGVNTVTIGLSSVSIGLESFTLGRAGLSNGDHATSLNYFTKGTGNTSFSAGDGSEAIGNLSLTFGKNNQSFAYHCLSFGRNNFGISGSSNSIWLDPQPIFIIGNGPIPTDRNNVVFINKAGAIALNKGLFLPQSMVHIKTVLGTTEKHIQLQNSSNASHGSIQYDTHFNFQTSNQNGSYHWRDSMENIIMTNSTNGATTINGTAYLNTTIIEEISDISLTSDNQVINVSDNTYLRLTSDSSIETSRTIRLSNGTAIGHLLMIECDEGSSGTEGFEIIDEGTIWNTNTSGSFIMNSGDTALFIWNGTDWLLVRRSDN